MSRLETLTTQQRDLLDLHLERWRQIILRTGPADRPAFEAAARVCCRHVGAPWHDNVVWVGSPLVLTFAAPSAAFLIQCHRNGVPLGGWAGRAVEDMILEGGSGTIPHTEMRDLVGGAVRAVLAKAVLPGPELRPERLAVDGALRAALQRSAHEAGYVRTLELRYRTAPEEQLAGDSLRRLLVHKERELISRSVHASWILQTVLSDMVLTAVYGARRRMLPDQCLAASIQDRNIRDTQWLRSTDLERAVRLGYLRQLCDVTAGADLQCLPGHATAYEQLFQSAFWWYSHRDFLMVCERPREIHAVPAVRAPDTQHLHRLDGPALSWPDGFRIHAVRGRLMPAWIIENPGMITVGTIDRERNAEVRLIMIERFGWSRYLAESGAEVLDEVGEDHPLQGLRGARLLRKQLQDEDEARVYLEMVNSTPEPDGTHRRYVMRVDPLAYGGDAGRYCHAAMASLWRYRDEDGELRPTFERWQDYEPTAES